MLTELEKKELARLKGDYTEIRNRIQELESKINDDKNWSKLDGKYIHYIPKVYSSYYDAYIYVGKIEQTSGCATCVEEGIIVKPQLCHIDRNDNFFFQDEAYCYDGGDNFTIEEITEMDFYKVFDQTVLKIRELARPDTNLRMVYITNKDNKDFDSGHEIVSIGPASEIIKDQVYYEFKDEAEYLSYFKKELPGKNGCVMYSEC